MASFELFALVFKDSPPSDKIFSVTASPADTSVSKLKQLVHKQKRNRFKDIDADDFVLWKVIPLYSCHRLMC
jgi:Crinkler effector protein N-terminal domain